MPLWCHPLSAPSQRCHHSVTSLQLHPSSATTASPPALSQQCHHGVAPLISAVPPRCLCVCPHLSGHHSVTSLTPSQWCHHGVTPPPSLSSATSVTTPVPVSAVPPRCRVPPTSVVPPRCHPLCPHPPPPTDGSLGAGGRGGQPEAGAGPPNAGLDGAGTAVIVHCGAKRGVTAG